MQGRTVLVSEVKFGIINGILYVKVESFANILSSLLKDVDVKLYNDTTYDRTLLVRNEELCF